MLLVESTQSRILRILSGSYGQGYCSFPVFLWQDSSVNEQKEWLSKTEYLHNSDTWARQKRLEAHETEVFVRERVHASCVTGEEDRNDTMPCFRKEISYTIKCVAKERGNVYRVQLNGEG